MQSWQNIRNTLKFLALLTVGITVTGTALYYYNLRKVIIRDGQREAAARVLAVEKRLEEGFARNLRTVKAIAGDIEVRNAVRGTRKNLGGTREHLLFYRRTFGFISCALLDRDGTIITSTDPSGALWPDGASQAPRPWLEAALAGDLTAYMMPGKDARRRRIVFSQPVYDAGASPAGVVLIETGTETPAQQISSAPEGILILSFTDGYIFLSSRASLLDRRLWGKPAKPAETSGQDSRFHAGPGEWSGMSKESPTEARDSDGRRYDIYERELTCCDGWTVTYLHDREAFMAAHVAPFFGKAWYAVVGFCLTVIFSALGFYRAASRDVSLRQSEEKLLAGSERRFHTGTHTDREAIFTVAEDDTVVYCNEAAAALFGLPKERIEKHPVTLLIARKDLEQCRLATSGDSWADEPIHAMECLGLREGKAPFPIEMSLSDWETGGRSFSTIVVRDITLRKVTEEALREAGDSREPKGTERTGDRSEAGLRLLEMDRLKNMFLAGMSRELRTPLNSIIGFTGILLQDMSGSLTAEQQGQLDLVSKSACHLLALVNDAIDISKIEAGHISPQIDRFNAAELIGDVARSFEFMAADRRISLSSRAEGALDLATDRRRIKQVLVSLVSNALKFTDGGGSVTIAAAEDNGMVRLSVRDTGMGIREQDREKLFRPFSRIPESENIEGAGLGLYISDKITRLLGGRIDVESTYGAGSEFTLTLPAARDSEGA